jgi:hypothetical protein
MGLAPVCKQNFALALPVLVLVLGDLRAFRSWVAAGLPILTYMGVVAAGGGLKDAIDQVLALSGFRLVGVDAYVQRGMLLGPIAIGAAATWCARRWPPVAPFAALVLAAWLTYHLFHIQLFPWMPAFDLFGLALGATLVLARERGAARGEVSACIASLAVGWSASISLGYNTPVLGAGLMTAALFHAAPWPGSESAAWSRGWSRYSLWLHPMCALTALGVFVWIRRESIYHDLPASALTSSLEGRLPGGALLSTNPLTAAYIDDVGVAIEVAHGRTYALIPNFPGWWAKSTQQNPLPVDWLYWQELPRPELAKRVVDAVAAQRGRIVVIAEKANLGGLVPGPAGGLEIYSPALSYVRQNWHRMGQTRFFELFE